MNIKVNISLEENINNMKKKFHYSNELKIRNIKPNEIIIIYLDGIIDSKLIQEYVIKPMLLDSINVENPHSINQKLERIIESVEIKYSSLFDNLVDAIVSGDTVMFINGYSNGIIFPSGEWKERSIEESIGERSPRGPVIGLTEKLKTNINILRSSIKTPDLCVENMEIGMQAKTSVSILYLNGIVDIDILVEVKERINKLKDIKYLPNSRIVEDAIEGWPPAIFPLVSSYERIDSITSSLFEGRVIVLIDGIPHAIVAPSLFMESLQAPDEYHVKFGRFSIRFLRFLGLLAGIYLPAIYIALFNFHLESFSKKHVKLLFTNGEFISPFWEIVILLLIIRVLIDASFRLPKSAVLLVSLIGTIVIGQTAVTAKLIHPVCLIIVGITTLSSFLVINKGFAAAENILRIIMLIISYFFDFVGLTIMTTLLIIYLISLKSVGVPYFAPLIPLRINELKDTLYRGNLKKLINSKHTFRE